MREHVPVESEKVYGYEGQSDEEAPAVVEITPDEKIAVAVVKGTTQI
jgi:hypothetical protein